MKAILPVSKRIITLSNGSKISILTTLNRDISSSTDIYNSTLMNPLLGEKMSGKAMEFEEKYGKLDFFD